MRWTRDAAQMGDKWSAYTVLVGEPEGKRPVRRARCRWVYNIKLDHRKRGGEVWMGLIGSV
jgi:hypothetical protein